MHLRAHQAEETKALLITTARRLFAEKGYHGAGTHEIVERAGVTRGALYHHFSSKEALFVAVFHQVQHELRQTAELPGKGTVGWVGLLKNFEWFLRTSTTADVQRILLLDGPAVLGWAEWRRLEIHYGLKIIGAAIEDGIEQGLIRPQPIEPLGHLIIAMIDEAALYVANAPSPENAARDAAVAIRTLVRNLA